MKPASPSAILLVDGYNIIGASPGLGKTMRQHGLETARTELIEALISYSAYQGYETQVVFDACYQGNPGHHEVVTSHLAVRYTDYRQTADTFIEKTCAQFRNDVRKLTHRLIVATSDRAQQLTVVGYGAECISAQRLLSEVDLVRQRVRRRQKPQRQTSSRFLAKALDPVAQERLNQLRYGFRLEGK
ncbi:MAG: NYN domain-containing protein [Synechococcales bacterium]|nr:NYN domain-containing protein [Synechococcales bacterium]